MPAIAGLNYILVSCHKFKSFYMTALKCFALFFFLLVVSCSKEISPQNHKKTYPKIGDTILINNKKIIIMGYGG